MRTYNSYKDSGVDWIGEIPTHWGVRKIKFVASINDDTLSEKTDEEFLLEYVDISSVEVNVGVKNTESIKFKEAPSRARRLVKDGDVIVSTVRTYLKAIAKIVNPTSNLVVSTGFAVIRPRQVDSNYLGHLLYHDHFLGEIFSRSVGVSYPAINSSEIGTIKITCPSKEEQSAIASYLDRKTAEIDELIADKKRLLGLYEEERSAVINQAVTKGINPDAPMKDSGIEWMGEIPEHWEVKRIDRVANIVRGNTGFKKDELLVSGEYVALQYGKTYKVNEINGSFNFFVNSEFYKSNQIVQFGDVILISTSETLEDLGHSCFYARLDIGLLGGEQILLRPISSTVSGKYLYYSSKVFCVQLRKFATGIKVFRFNIDNLKEMYTAIPSIEEQILIVEYIDNQITRLDTKKAKTEKLINLLTEYRTALISEVVTGKVKVID